MTARTLRAIAVLAVALGVVAPAAAHPRSISSSRIRVQDGAVVFDLRCQARSLADVVAGLDADGDGVITAVEVAPHEDAILDYVAAHSVLSIDGRRLTAAERAILHEPPGAAPDVPSDGGTIDIVRIYAVPTPPRTVGVRMTLFRRTSPDHVDLIALMWNDTRTDHFALSAHRPTATSGADPPGTFSTFFTVGTRHMLGGWDHLAFLVALLLTARGVRQLLGIVTAFTAAHSVTLGLVALGAVNVSPVAPLIEALIALSIAYVAVDGLVHPHTTRGRWIEAFGFGLLHGLGFAGFIRRALFFERDTLTALLGFNLGVEAGQVLVILALIGAGAVFIRRRKRASGEDMRPLAPAPLRMIGLAVAAGLGLFWFFARL